MRSVMLMASAVAMIAGAGVLASCATAGGQGASSASVEAGAIVATRRLTESQYRNTIADIFGKDVEVNARFEPEQRDHGLLAIGGAKLSLSAGGFEQYAALARSIADQAMDPKRRDRIMPCKPADPKAADDACTEALVRKYGRLLYRRAVRDAEVAAYVALAKDAAVRNGDFYSGARLALANLLTSPEYLFRMERVEGSGRRARLDGYAKAARLSYLMWDSTPDEELLAAAESGAIHTEQGLQQQIERLAASPRLEAGVRAFFTDMLQLELFETVTKDPGTYPKYSIAVANAAREQTLRTLVDHLVVKNGDYRDVFTSPDTFIDRSLAAIYDVPYLSTQPWSAYRFDAGADRGGILTQVTFLTLFSHPGRSSPTKRGVALNEIFLCEETPTPPPDVDFSIVQDVGNPLLKTVRARLLAHATDETCAGCHNLTDPIGLSLERFDSIGQTRLMENGEKIDVTAELDGVKFEGATGLGGVLRDNPRVARCLVRNVYAYGVGRHPDAEWEEAYLDAQTKAFSADGYRLPGMMRRIPASPDFFRVVRAAPPRPAAPDSSQPKAPAAVAGLSSPQGGL